MKMLKNLIILLVVFSAIGAILLFGVSKLGKTVDLPAEPEGLVSESEPFMTGDGMKLAMEQSGCLDKERTKIALESLKNPDYQYVWTKNNASYINEVPGTYKAYYLTRADFEKNLDSIDAGNLDDATRFAMDLKTIYNTSKEKISYTFNRDYKKYPENFKEIEDLTADPDINRCDFFDPEHSYFKLQDGVESLGVYGLPELADYFYFDGKYKTECSEPKFLKMIAGEIKEGKAVPDFIVTCIYEFDLTTIEHGNKKVSAEWFPEVGETNKITIALSGYASVTAGIYADFQPYSFVVLDYEKVDNNNN